MHYLTSALDGGEWSASHPGHFTPRESAYGNHVLKYRVFKLFCLRASGFSVKSLSVTKD
jgi:hypothetical protein